MKRSMPSEISVFLSTRGIRALSRIGLDNLYFLEDVYRDEEPALYMLEHGVFHPAKCNHNSNPHEPEPPTGEEFKEEKVQETP